VSTPSHEPFSEGRLVEGFANAESVVVEESSVHHELELAVLEAGAALGAVHEHGEALLLGWVPEGDPGVDGVVVPGDLFLEVDRPRGPGVPRAQQHLAAVGVGEELALGLQGALEPADDLLADGVLDRDGPHVPDELHVLLVGVRTDHLAHPRRERLVDLVDEFT